MSNMEENYLDNLLKNVMEPHPVEPREREQTDTAEGKEEISTIEEPVLDELNLDELNFDELNLDEAVLEALGVEEPIVEEPAMEAMIQEEPVLEAMVQEELAQEEPVLEELMQEELVQEEEPVLEELNLDEAVLEALGVEEPIADEAVLEALGVEEPIADEPVLEAMIQDEPVLEAMVQEEPILEDLLSEMPDLGTTEFSLDELDEALAEPAQAMEQSSDTSEDSIDLEALEELLNSAVISSEVENMPEIQEMSNLLSEASEIAGSEINLDQLDEDVLKDIGLFTQDNDSSDVSSDEEEYDDVLSLLNEDDSDLAEISDLLKKSDSKEPVQDDMMALLSQMADDEEKQYEETNAEKAEVEPEPEAMLNNIEVAEEASKTKKQKKAKEAKKQKADTNKSTAEKKQGAFAKLFHVLTEEFEPEPTEEELAKEAAEKAAAKQEAKAKKEEEKKAKAEENKVKAEEKDAAKKAKAEAAAQQKKEKQEAKAAKKAAKLAKEEAERPKNQKRISPKKMILVTLFAASVLAVVLLFTNFISTEGSLQRARKAYYAGNYQTVYVELYGSELEESDALVQARSKVILKMQRKYDSYVNHMKMGQDVKALNALIEGLRTYDVVNMEAEQYGVMAEVDEIKTNILNVLDAKYGIDEAAARELLQNEDEISYTKSLNHIIMGNSSDLVSNL